jgi:lipid A 4'-phosphatase
VSFAASSLLLTALPGIDIQVSKMFFDGRFHLDGHWLQKLLQEGLTYLICVSMVSILAVYLYSKWSRRDSYRVDGKKVAYLFLVLIVGAGLIVNVILKDNFGRARPRDVEEFGGAKLFTPAFVISQECERNCSFSSGEGAAGFFCVTLALALSRRRTIHLVGAAVGALVSFSRIASGAHFLSDTVVSFFVMLIVADVLYYYLFLTHGAREPLPATAAVHVFDPEDQGVAEAS